MSGGLLFKRDARFAEVFLVGGEVVQGYGQKAAARSVRILGTT